MDKYTGENITTVVTDLRQPMDIKIFHPVVQPNGTNHCSDVDGKPVCDQFCFPKPWIKDSTTGLFTYVLIPSEISNNLSFQKSLTVKRTPGYDSASTWQFQKAIQISVLGLKEGSGVDNSMAIMANSKIKISLLSF